MNERRAGSTSRSRVARVCRALLVVAACATPIAAGVGPLAETAPPTKLIVHSPHVLGFRAAVPGPQRFWIRGEREEVAMLADGRSVLLEAVDVAGEAWRVSPPMLLARGDGALLLTDAAGGGGFLSSDAWGWPVAGREEGFARITDTDASLPDHGLRPPVLLVFAPIPGATAPRLELANAGEPLRVTLSDQAWTIRHGSDTRSVPALPTRALSRWILRLPTRASQLVVELGRSGSRVFAEQRFAYEVRGRFEVSSHEGLVLRGIVPGAEREREIRPPDGDEVGWIDTDLVAGDAELPARIYAYFLSSSFDVTASLPPGGGVVLSFESPRRFVVADCLGAAQVRVRSVDAGAVTNEVRVPAECDAVEVEKRPGTLVVARAPIAAAYELGSIGCLRSDAQRGCKLRVRDLSGRF